MENSFMISDSEKKIFAKLATLETEITTLRDGYLVVNQRYSAALGTMKTLTALTLDAALRSATAAEKSALASKNAAAAAVAAASVPVIEAALSAAEAAGLAAVAAAEASAAAASAASATATAAAIDRKSVV